MEVKQPVSEEGCKTTEQKRQSSVCGETGGITGQAAVSLETAASPVRSNLSTSECCTDVRESSVCATVATEAERGTSRGRKRKVSEEMTLWEWQAQQGC